MRMHLDRGALPIIGIVTDMAHAPRTPLRRSTRQSRLVFEAVSGTKSHPTAEWVYDAVQRSLPRVSLGTVYRNLQKLVDEGRIRSFVRGGRIRYEADLTVHSREIPHETIVEEIVAALAGKFGIPRAPEGKPAT